MNELINQWYALLHGLFCAREALVHSWLWCTSPFSAQLSPCWTLRTPCPSQIHLTSDCSGSTSTQPTWSTNKSTTEWSQGRPYHLTQGKSMHLTVLKTIEGGEMLMDNLFQNNPFSNLHDLSWYFHPFLKTKVMIN